MGKHLDRFEAGFDRLMIFLASLVAASIALFAIMIPLDLLIRSLGWGNFPWLYEGIEYALYFGIFLGAPWVLREGAHVRVDVLLVSLPKAVAARLEQAVDLGGAVISGVLCIYGVRSTIEHFVEGTIPDKLLVVANWYLMAAFTVAFFMLAIEFLLRLRRANAAEDQEESVASGAGF